MGKHHHASRAKVLLVIGVSLLLLGIALLSIYPLAGGDGAPPSGPQASDTPETITAITGLISAVAGLITSIVGLLTALSVRRSKSGSSAPPPAPAGSS
jgi:ABC-type Fe3+ transport system permease subunit